MAAGSGIVNPLLLLLEIYENPLYWLHFFGISFLLLDSSPK